MRERLQKYLARAGVASRRACEDLIRSGLIMVNHRVERTLGATVEPGVDIIEYDGRRIEVDERRVYLLLYKPEKVISAASDPERRPVVTSLVPAEFGRLYPVGRLDWDSEGAILMTNDGELTDLLTHPKHEVEKSYLVKVTGMITDDDPRIDKIRRGVKLDDGYKTLPATVIRDGDTGKHTWFVVAIREGKNRQIRRMFEAVAIDVRRLRRVAYGPVLLGALEPGEFRRLTEEEIDELYIAAGRPRSEESASRGRISFEKREGKLEGLAQAKRDVRAVRRERAAEAPAKPGARAPGARAGAGSARPGGPRTERPAPSKQADGRRPESEGGARSAGTSGARGGRPAAPRSADGRRPEPDGAPRGTGAPRGARPASAKRPERDGGSRSGAPVRGERPASSRSQGSGGAPPKRTRR